MSTAIATNIWLTPGPAVTGPSLPPPTPPPHVTAGVGGGATVQAGVGGGSSVTLSALCVSVGD